MKENRSDVELIFASTAVTPGFLGVRFFGPGGGDPRLRFFLFPGQFKTGKLIFTSFIPCDPSELTFMGRFKPIGFRTVTPFKLKDVPPTTVTSEGYVPPTVETVPLDEETETSVSASVVLLTEGDNAVPDETFPGTILPCFLVPPGASSIRCF